MVTAEMDMEASTYSVLQKCPSGEYKFVGEIGTFEQAQIESLLLEAEHPGEYVVCNSASGKLVSGSGSGPYVC